MMTQPTQIHPLRTTDAGRGCDACPHTWSSHDVTAARYCRATVARVLTRGCVCVAESAIHPVPAAVN